MKAKISFTIFLSFLFYLSANGQYTIVSSGGDFFCIGGCTSFELYDNNGVLVDDENLVWDFGDGATSQEPHPFYCFYNFGQFVVTVSLGGSVLAELVISVDCCPPLVDGPTSLCVGECATYVVTGGAAPYTFDLNNGEIISGDWCPSAEGQYILYVTDSNGCYSTIDILVTNIGTPDIFSLSGAFCLDDSLSSCERVCENTTVTYTTEVNNPNTNITWSVNGAENWTANGNEVTVEWGDPGQGQVSVVVGNGTAASSWNINCGSYLDASFNAGDGIGFVYVDGPIGTYFGEIYLDGNLINTYAFQNNSGSMEFFYNLEPGYYTLSIEAPDGTNQTCNFIIQEIDIPCQELGYYFLVTPSSGPDCCNGGIETVLVGNASGPFSYQWSNGVTTQDMNFDLCLGLYSLTVTDGIGCTTVSSVTVPCTMSQGCSGTNSLCVDILEIPESAFETNPPAVNGVVEICEGQTVFFDNQTNGSFNYTWDFGDGVSSSLVDAEHTYLSPGTYEAILIARNDCFCADSSSVTILVEEAITPEVDCAGTICPGEEITYTSNADCGTFYWNVSTNGTIISGGGLNDDFITVDWGAGPEGIIELSVDNCSGDYCVQTLFETIPIIDDNAEIQGPERVCKGAEVIYSLPAFAGTEFVWSVSSFGTISEGQGTNEVTIQWANEVTPIQQQVICQYESCYLGCGGQDTLLVNILNEVFIEGPIETCPGDMQTYTCRTPLGQNVQADWFIYNSNGVTVATSAAPTPDFDVNWIYGSGNYTVHAEVQNPSNYCIDNFSVFVDVVAPTTLPTSITGELLVCPGTNYTYEANSAGTGFDYTWYVSDGGNNYILNGKTVNIAWENAPPYTLAVSQTNLDGFSCESETIEINPQLINTVSLTGTPTVCHEGIGNYSATLYPDLEYNWQVTPSDAGSIISGDQTNEVEIQWHAPGTHDLSVTVCGVTDQIPVNVLVLPTPQPIVTPVCPGQTTTISLTQTYNTYQWKNEAGATMSFNPTANLGTGYYEVIVSDNNGCTGNEIFFVPTYGQPNVTISTPDFGNFCAVGGSMTLYALESSSGPLDYQWFRNNIPFGTNSSSQVINQEGSYYVEVTDINGCTDISNILGLSCGSLPGDPSPGCVPDGFPDFEIQQGVFCNESTYINTSVNDIPNTWGWEFWDIVGGNTNYSNVENPTTTWTNAGFNIVVFSANIQSTTPGEVCPMLTIQFDTIPLAADFIHEGTCIGELISFEDLSTFIPQTSISGWEWDFGDPVSGSNNSSNQQNPSHVYSSSGFYNVVLTVTDQSGCISQSQSVVEIVDPPLASFSIPNQSCEGASMFFEANGNFTDITWDFGDPASGAANISNIDETYHVYSSPGNYTVTLIVENIFGCIESVTEVVNITPNNLGGLIDVNPATEVCEGDSVILTAPLADSYAWSTGAVSQSITVFEAADYDVTIYDPIGCGYTTPPVVIDLIPLPQGQITAVEYNEFEQPINYIYNNYETCYGEDVYLEIIENPNYTYEWPDGQTTTEISFTEEKENLLEVGTHIFEVEVTDQTTGCTNIIGPFTVTVHPVPENVIITSMPAAPVCENTPTVISVLNPDPSFIYIWNTGQVGTSINTFYAGAYFVRAINQFGCEGESNTLEIVPGPNLDLIPSGCHTRCNPDTICLPPITNVASFQWYLDGSPIPAPEGNDPDYIATESGEYYVEMISGDGCVTISDILTLDLFDGFGNIEGNVYFDINENGVIDAADTLMMNVPIILYNNGIPVDTLISNQIGSFAFIGILSTDYEIGVDTLNLANGMTAIISQASAQLVGCDDEAAVEFLIQFICPDISETLTLNACPDETVDYNGTTLSIGDTQQFSFLTPFGCDSTVTVSVMSLTESSNSITLQACTGSTIDYNGTALSGGTVMDFVFDNAIGCDSVVTVTVIESDQDSLSITLATCTGTTIDYNGNSLAPGTQQDFMYTGSGGCDSIVTVIVNESLAYFETVSLEACTGESVLYNGEMLMAGSSTTFDLTTIENCDSTVVVNVEELESSSEPLQLSACNGDSVLYNSTFIHPGDNMTFTFTNSVGCDSVIEVSVEALALYNDDLELFACEGETVEFNNQQLAAGTITPINFTSQDGCDSIVTVTVTEVFESTSFLYFSACEGDTYPYNGQQIPPGNTMEFTFTNVGGCDSLVTVIVATLFNSESFVDLEVCPGETIEYNGIELAQGFDDTFLFTDQNGCDSIVYVSVAAFPDFSFDVDSEVACWNDDNGALTITNVNGGTGPFLYSIDGVNFQDSVEFNNLNGGDFSVSVIDDNGCTQTFETIVEETDPIEVVVTVPEVPCDFSPVRIELEFLSQNTGELAYQWSDSSSLNYLEVDTAGVYSVEISNACESVIQTFDVQLAADARENYFYVPNVFSPNNDGMNDRWKIMPPENMEVLSFELMVFDRWGNHLKTFAGIDDYWDASFKGEEMKAGVYVYWYRATVLSCGRRLEVFDKGDVTIVK